MTSLQHKQNLIKINQSLIEATDAVTDAATLLSVLIDAELLDSAKEAQVQLLAAQSQLITSTAILTEAQTAATDAEEAAIFAASDVTAAQLELEALRAQVQTANDALATAEEILWQEKLKILLQMPKRQLLLH